jgi:benzoyl-CoA 2,3-dioxygenase component B
LKGRFGETNGKTYEDHVALETYRDLKWMEEGRLTNHEIPMRRAMNLELADSYRKDCSSALNRWNKFLEEAGLADRLYLPELSFNRKVGVFSEHDYDVSGNPVAHNDFASGCVEWLPSEADKAYVKSLMVPCLEPGKFANWIAPPRKGIQSNPIEFPYVQFHDKQTTEA